MVREVDDVRWWKIAVGLAGSAVVEELIAYLLKRWLPASPNKRRVLAVCAAVLLLLFLLVWLTVPQESNLFIRGESSTQDVYFVEGEVLSGFGVGDQLIVYDTPTTSAQEEPVALLKVVAIGRDDLLMAQAWLVHPTIRIRPGLRVDKTIDVLGTSRLIPVHPLVDDYLLDKGLVVLRNDESLEQGDILIALESQGIDYIGFDPPVTMRLQQVGIDSVVARAELLTGEWPEVGTSLMRAISTPLASVSTTPFPTGSASTQHALPFADGSLFGFPAGPAIWQGYFALAGDGGGRIFGTLHTSYPHLLASFVLPGGGGRLDGNLEPQENSIFCLTFGETMTASVVFEGVVTEGYFGNHCEFAEAVGYFHH